MAILYQLWHLHGRYRVYVACLKFDVTLTGSLNESLQSLKFWLIELDLFTAVLNGNGYNGESRLKPHSQIQLCG